MFQSKAQRLFLRKSIIKDNFPSFPSTLYVAKPQRKIVQILRKIAQKEEKWCNFVKKVHFFLEVTLIFCIFATEEQTTVYIYFQYIVILISIIIPICYEKCYIDNRSTIMYYHGTRAEDIFLLP